MKTRYAFLAASRISAAILQTLALLLLARWSSPATFGLVAAFLGAMMFASAATNLGLANYVSRARALDKTSGLVPAAVLLNRYTSLLLAIGGTAIGIWMGLSTPLAILIAISTALDKNSDTTTSVLIADRSFTAPSFVMLLRRSISFIVLPTLYLAATPFPVEIIFAAGLLVGSLVGNLVAHLAVRRKIDWSSRASLRTVFRETRSFWIALIGNQLKELHPTVVLFAAGPHIGGLFSAALRFTRPMVLIAGFAAQLLLPAVSRRGETGWSAAKVVAFTSLATTMVLAVALPFIPWIIDVIVGAGYEEAVLPTQILLLGSPVVASAVPLGAILQGQGLVRESALLSFSFGALTLIVLLIVSTTGDVTSAALTVVLTSLSQVVIQLFLAWRTK